MTEVNQQNEKVIIIGAGPAGLSAALYAARAELNPLVLTGMELGGQASLTNTIENYPGFLDGIGGSQLGEVFQKQAERFGARMEYDSVTAVDLSKRPFKVSTYGKEYLAETLILATGASPVHLNIPGEELLTGKGVSYCATCDGWFFKGKEVAVIGGGDSALEEALFLTRFATKVTVIHRRDAFRAGAILQKRLHDNEKITTILDSVAESVVGTDKVTALKLRNVKTGAESEFACDGAFIFVGHSPNTQLYQGQLEMDERGYLKIDGKLQTSVAGVFAAGEVADSTYKQVVTSAGMGAAAAIQALHFLEE
ncbi:MAG: thioredoxin-disulfide reductase [Anaerolineaceae bacterium]|nr:thioredoxin-disulfide reductase [Anaerolineaceae bacterium]